MMDYAILGDELMNYYNDKNLMNQTFIQDYIKQEKTKFMFGCTTRLNLKEKKINNLFYTRETHLFVTQSADGIVGLGINSNS